MDSIDEQDGKSKKVPHAVAIFLLFILLALLYAGNRNQGTAETGELLIRGHTISVLTADTMGRLLKGLGGQTELSRDSGLFFVFSESARHGIWMKDMRFPIDVVWLQETRTNADCAPDYAERDLCMTVVDMKADLAPETFPEVFYPTGNARYALELNAGKIHEIGIQRGDRAVFR